ncbi:GNAT family N-acetyltransferase [Pseudomonas indica]|uniref:L-methionine sulfoximine/L-methionine sulfone acetyltransferase n=1 Tax=Pseudomonas indica TaxID=137658 RepID=A0A1G9K3F5_9PSED|nr:GNAT family N-acetyltransferase [Pseudomonas indica]SDL44321.1 phosphinothricin acetyltransferase [Pseudomonas indica]
MHIRDATDADLAGILEIYNDAVLNTTAIWNEKTVDLANRRAWLAERNAQGYPVLVAVDEQDQVLGYASFGDWRTWDGYRHTVEHSVYVKNDHIGAGIGKALMRALIDRARALGKHVMVAGIESENRASIHMHQQLGFVHVGQLREVGTKFGRWLDLTFMQLIINPQRSAT